MSLPERTYAVWLGRTLAGHLHQRGDHTRFSLVEEYRADPERPTLGLLFEQDLDRVHSAALRLPPWFSNLLPEGVLRRWIAEDRGVSADREMELLAQVGHDLPISPAYDLVSTAPYRVNGAAEDLGLKFGGSTRFRRVHLGSFQRLEERLGAEDAGLVDCAVDTVTRVLAQWPRFEEHLRVNPRLHREIAEGIEVRAKALAGHRAGPKLGPAR